MKRDHAIEIGTTVQTEVSVSVVGFAGSTREGGFVGTFEKVELSRRCRRLMTPPQSG
jgi:hypothetical protein